MRAAVEPQNLGPGCLADRRHLAGYPVFALQEYRAGAEPDLNGAEQAHVLAHGFFRICQ